MLEDIIGKIHIKNKLNHNDIGTHLLLTHYDKIKSLRPYKDPMNMEKWDQVIEKIVEGLTITKDLNLIAWLIESLSYRYNIQGLYAGLQILENLLKTFPHCYPKDTEKQTETIGWIKENFAFWLKEEEIFPGVQFRQIHQAIHMSKIDSKIILGLALGKDELTKYIENKRTALCEIKTFVEGWQTKTLEPLAKQILSFLIKLDNFYSQAQMINSKEQRCYITENTNWSKDKIYVEINDLVKHGLEIDPHDVLLYIIHKILNIRKKNSNELVMKIIRENSIESILNS